LLGVLYAVHENLSIIDFAGQTHPLLS